MPPELSDDHMAAICQVLKDHEVEFVIIGGIAARLHDTGHTTIDVDICPSLNDAHLSNLADALREVGARLRVEEGPAGVAFDPYPAMLRDVEMMTLITEEGPLDLCFTAAGLPGGYGSLSAHASVIVVGTVDVPVASLRDVATSNAPQAAPKTSLPSHRSRLTSPAGNGDIGREVDAFAARSRVRVGPRDDENQPEVMIPARIRGKSSGIAAAVVDLNLGVGSRDHVAST